MHRCTSHEDLVKNLRISLGICGVFDVYHVCSENFNWDMAPRQTERF